MLEKNFFIDIHPGELLSGMLEDERLSQADLARAMGCSRKVISEICTRKRGISADMAFKLGKVFGQSPQFWMNAQSNWLLSRVDRSTTAKVKRLVCSRAA
jgi:antitoxin HigA-1